MLLLDKASLHMLMLARMWVHGVIARLTEKECIKTLKGIVTKVNGRTISNTDRVLRLGKMAHHTKEIIFKTRKKEEESIAGSMDQHAKGTGSTTKYSGLVYTCGKMVESVTASGSTTTCLATE